MQQVPTCTGIRVRNADDARKIFYAVHKGILPAITRRLDQHERLNLGPGSVYVWERHASRSGLGLERFTEGRKWGPSRIRDDFLFYYEKCPEMEGSPPSRWDQLVKQTYSVEYGDGDEVKEWHMNCYFTQATVDSLASIDDLPELQALQVPPGYFTKRRKSKKTTKEPVKRRDTKDGVAPSSPHTYAPYPLTRTPTAKTEAPDTSPLLPPPHTPTSFLHPSPIYTDPAMYASVWSPGALSPTSPTSSLASPIPSWPLGVRGDSVDSDGYSESPSESGSSSVEAVAFPLAHAGSPHFPRSFNNLGRNTPMFAPYTSRTPSSLAHWHGEQRYPAPHVSVPADLAPLQALEEPHPYRRELMDDMQLRALGRGQ